MHATEKNRISTCSTDNGSVDAHGGASLAPVLSNQSASSVDAKKSECGSPVSISVRDAADAQSPVTSAPHTRSSSHASAAASPSRSDNMPASAAVHLSTLLVTGQRKTWKFGPNETVEAVRNHIWNHWPESWPQPKPESSAYLRLLHLGHILDAPELTLASRGCKAGTTTVVHIIIRSLPPPEPTKVEQGKFDPTCSTQCRCTRRSDPLPMLTNCMPSESPVKTTAAEPGQARRGTRQQEDTPGCSCVIC